MEKKRKVKKVIQIIYNFISGLFIVVVIGGLILNSCRNKSQYTPTIETTLNETKQRKNAIIDEQYLTYEQVLQTCDIYKPNYLALHSVGQGYTSNTAFFILGRDEINSLRCYRAYKSAVSGSSNGDYTSKLTIWTQPFTNQMVIWDAEPGHDVVNFQDYNYNGVYYSVRYLAIPHDYTPTGDNLYNTLFNPSYKIYDCTTDYKTFEFAENINFNAFGQIESDIGNVSAYQILGISPFTNILASSSSIYKDVDFTIGNFVCNGAIYDTIRVHFINSGDYRFVDNNGSVVNAPTIGSNNNHYYAITSISYHNSYSNTTLNVWSRTTFYDGGVTYNLYGTWLASEYRNIKLLVKVSQYNNILFQNVNNNSIGAGYVEEDSGYLKDAFGLIGGAFASVMPFFTIQILPGISIFLLLLVPFAITLIIAIVKLLRK